MTPAQIGGMAGATFGLIGFAALRFVADRIVATYGGRAHTPAAGGPEDR